MKKKSDSINIFDPVIPAVQRWHGPDQKWPMDKEVLGRFFGKKIK